MKTQPRVKLGEMLLSAGLLTQLQLDGILRQQQETPKRFGTLLIDSEIITEDDLTEAISLQIDTPFIRLGDFTPSIELTDLVPESVARTYKIFPIDISATKMAIAMSDTMDVEAIDTINRITGKRIEPVLSSKKGIEEAIEKHYGHSAGEKLSASLDEAVDQIEIETEEDQLTDVAEERRISDQAPVIRAVNMILQEAIRQKASDIHLEPRANCMEVRYRVDGVLHAVKSIPKKLESAMISRIKIMADMDISEKRKPQDGRISGKILGRNVDLRISSLPIQYGERVVLRVLDKQTQQFAIDQLGLVGEDLIRFQHLVSKPYGLILVTGPTGSGKTTTLYSALNHIKSIDTNIMTCEDPIEYDMPGVNQSQVNVRAGLTFAAQLRAILRQDPDVILVGEIRDTETAEIAFQAAVTGHLVFSTLHCNDSPGAVTRLLDMEVEPFLIGSSVIGVLSQRLVRMLCPKCKAPYTPTSEDLLLLGADNIPKGTVFYNHVGCSACNQRGYQGRLAVVELMPISSATRQLIMQRATSEQIKAHAVKDGMRTMRDHAVNRVIEGLTTFDEVRRQVFVEEVD